MHIPLQKVLTQLFPVSNQLSSISALFCHRIVTQHIFLKKLTEKGNTENIRTSNVNTTIEYQ